MSEPTKAEIERALYPKRKGTPEGNTQRAILELLTVKGIFAFRLNTAAVKVEGRFFRSHSLGKGAADILAFLEEYADFEPRFQIVPTWIEVKAPDGSQTTEQRSFQVNVESKGHHYLLVRNVDQVSEFLKEHGA